MRQRWEPDEAQAHDIQALLDGGLRGVVAAETGAGKTLIAVEVMLRAEIDTVLVIALQDTHLDEWGETIRAQSEGRFDGIRVIDSSAPGKAAFEDLEIGEPGFYTMTPQLFTRWSDPSNEKGPGGMGHIVPDLTVVDEAHMLGAHGTKGNDALLAFGTRGAIVMSATWFRNKFENAWGLLSFVYPHLDGPGEIADRDYKRWINFYCETAYDRFSPTKQKIVGELRPGEIASKIPTYIFHLKRGVCCQFHPVREGFPEGGFMSTPEPKIIEHVVPLTAGQMGALQQMEDAMLFWLKDEAENARAFVTKVPAVKALRLRQMSLGMPSFTRLPDDPKKETGPRFEIGFDDDCESPKLDLFIGRLAATPEQQWLALTSSEKFAEVVVRRLRSLGIAAEKRSGKVSKKEREEQKARFIAGETRVIVGQTEASGTGMDGLQHAAHRMFWFDRSTDLTTNTQAIGRLDRRGQQQQVVMEYAVAVGTVLDKRTRQKKEWSADRGILSQQTERQLRINKSLKRQHLAAVEAQKQAARSGIDPTGVVRTWPPTGRRSA